MIDTNIDEDGESAIDGMKCPKCGHTGSFLINATSQFEVHRTGVGEHADVEWDEFSDCTCPECFHGSTVAGFKGKETDADIIKYPPKKKTDGWIIIDGDLNQPTLRDGNDQPIIFKSERAAQLELADDIRIRLEQFMRSSKEREFDDIVWNTSVMGCTVHPDGYVATEDGGWSRKELQEMFK